MVMTRSNKGGNMNNLNNKRETNAIKKDKY